MTENEAISMMRNRIDTASKIAGKGTDGKAFEDMEMAISALKEIQQYRKIGTVEECREAVKKQKPKKPNRSGMDEQDWYTCPNCGADIGSVDDCFPRDRYCPNCGQAIQWSENLGVMENEEN